MTKDWAVRVDGDILFRITGPNAEAIVRAAAQTYGGVAVWREDVKPAAANGWELSGPWQDAE